MTHNVEQKQQEQKKHTIIPLRVGVVEQAKSIYVIEVRMMVTFGVREPVTDGEGT